MVRGFYNSIYLSLKKNKSFFWNEMKKKEIAIYILLTILAALLLLHALIFFEIIPFDKVWAGQLKTVEEMRTFELFSIVINAFMLSIIYIKLRFLKTNRSNRIIDYFIWLFALFFALNTIGNLFANSALELIVGSLTTFTVSLLCIYINLKK